MRNKEIEELCRDIRILELRREADCRMAQAMIAAVLRLRVAPMLIVDNEMLPGKIAFTTEEQSTIDAANQRIDVINFKYKPEIDKLLARLNKLRGYVLEVPHGC